MDVGIVVQDESCYVDLSKNPGISFDLLQHTITDNNGRQHFELMFSSIEFTFS